MARIVRLGERDVKFGHGELLQPAFDSGPMLAAGDFEGLRLKFEEDGFLVLKKAIAREAVLAARQFVLDDFGKRGGILDGEPSAAILTERCELGCIPFLEGYNDITHSASVLRVLEAPEIRTLFQGLFSSEVRTFDYKWLRGVPRKGFTGCHVDNVYMSRGTPRLHTCWIPFDDCTLELGGLAMCAGSHRLPGFSHFQSTYGSMDVERVGLDGTGWFTNDPAEVAALDPEAQWRAIDYEAGDVVIFGLRTAHMSTANLTDRVRISADVRWLPAHEIADPRYVGTAQEVDPVNRVKAGAWKVAGGEPSPSQPLQGPRVTLSELRAAWGFTPTSTA